METLLFELGLIIGVVVALVMRPTKIVTQEKIVEVPVERPPETPLPAGSMVYDPILRKPVRK